MRRHRPSGLHRRRRALWQRQVRLGNALACGAGAAVTVAGVVILVLVLLAPAGPPTPAPVRGGVITAPPISASPPVAGVVAPGAPADGSEATPAAAPVGATPPVAAGVAPSYPTSVQIPSIHVASPIVNLGLNPDQTPQVPPLTPAGTHEVAWYDLGPQPGQVGSAVLTGHVDSRSGTAVFYQLGNLAVGAAVQVTLADGQSVNFTVTAVVEYPKAGFPTLLVYGPVPYPALRLVTCGGAFDRSTGRYLSNIVAYAKMD